LTLNTKNILLLLSAVVAGLGLLSQQHSAPREKAGVVVSAPSSSQSSSAVSSGESDSAIDRAFANREHNVQVEGQGVVIKVLRDDDEGSRHQKFLLRMPSGLTILVAHNIDLASRVEGLRAGDGVEFNGDYEWSEKGGVVHWTHRDPAGRHVAGWLKHDGHTYQ
jgi:Protein of unknown function (DUF3465)